MPSPKLFISYSWTNPNHEAWVLRLATELRESGVDVVLDKWDLKEGHDANAFMEKMVSDPEIQKVLLVCDKEYAEKTDGRTGGVGTEAQIISSEIYAKESQDKFVAAVTERDHEGNACLPIYYKSRIYIDLSDQSEYAVNFEQLLRWVFDRPLYAKPEIGQKPAYLEEGKDRVALATSSRFTRAHDAIKNNRASAVPSTIEYFELLAEEVGRLRLDSNEDPFDDAVVASIASFLPYRNQAIDLFIALAMYHDSDESVTVVHRFFECLIRYLSPAPGVRRYNECDIDNFRFIIHELFLYALACYVSRERFDSAAYFLDHEYYVPNLSAHGQDVMVPFSVFRSYMPSLDERNKRLGLERASVRADLLEQRSKGLGIDFRHLMQVDFVLFLRDHLDRPKESFNWWPETLLYADYHAAAFEIFVRSRSTAYFERVKKLLGINAKEDLTPLLNSFAENPQLLPRWGFRSLSVTQLLGSDDIATRP